MNSDKRHEAKMLSYDSKWDLSGVKASNTRWDIRRIDMNDPEVMWWLGRWMQFVAIVGVSGGVGVVVWGVLRH